jgi:hypothetical protein
VTEWNNVPEVLAMEMLTMREDQRPEYWASVSNKIYLGMEAAGMADAAIVETMTELAELAFSRLCTLIDRSAGGVGHA